MNHGSILMCPSPIVFCHVYYQDEMSAEEYSDSDSDVPDELKNDYIDELTGETHSRYND